MLKYETRYKVPTGVKKIEIQKKWLDDGSVQGGLYASLSKWDIEHKCFLWSYGYDELRVMIDILVEIYDKQEVERELNIKIGGENK